MTPGRAVGVQVTSRWWLSRKDSTLENVFFPGVSKRLKTQGLHLGIPFFVVFQRKKKTEEGQVYNTLWVQRCLLARST